MFRWCAYCARFLGERDPWHDFSPTHGICPKCMESEAFDDRDAITRARPIIEFHEQLRAAATTLSESDLPAPDDLLLRGRALGVRSLDLLVGVLQPILYEIGRLWESGGLSPAVEARFTEFTGKVLDTLLLEQTNQRRPTSGRPIFLAAPPSNRHTVGIRMLGFALREAGHDVRVLAYPVGVDRLVELIALVEPSLVGISIARPDEAEYAIEVLARVERARLDTRIAIGGSALGSVDAASLPTRLGRMGDKDLVLLRPP